MSKKISLDVLRKALENTWTKETSNSPDKWKKSKPSVGQCAVTALIVNDICGGAIFRGEFSNGETHYWNLVGDNVVDLTRDQFKGELSFDVLGGRTRSQILKDNDTKQRYETLKEAVTAEIPNVIKNKGNKKENKEAD